MKNFKIPQVSILLSAIILFSGILTFIKTQRKILQVTCLVNNEEQALVEPNSIREVSKHLPYQFLFGNES